MLFKCCVYMLSITYVAYNTFCFASSFICLFSIYCFLFSQYKSRRRQLDVKTKNKRHQKWMAYEASSLPGVVNESINSIYTECMR